MLMVNFASWEQGLVVAPGNPLRIRGVQDLLRPKLRFLKREPGAGAHKLLEQMLRSVGARVQDLRDPGRVALGHMEVAEAVAMGASDAGISIRSAALAYGLDFVPLATERFDLVIPRTLATDPRVERVVDTLASRGFRRELESVGGYATRETGQQVAALRGR
jgi:putative molybdopterin biosynthesis protein